MHAIEASGAPHASQAAATLDSVCAGLGIAIDHILGLRDGIVTFAGPRFANAAMVAR
jgi:hypothetical protein